MNYTVERIVALMKEYGTTNAFIGRLVGKDRTTVSIWKSGKASPSEKDLEIIAKHFGVSLAYLIGESDEKEAVHVGLPPKTKQLLDSSSDLSNDELEKVLEYISFVKSQRK